jgi:hypothetical protein
MTHAGAFSKRPSSRRSFLAALLPAAAAAALPVIASSPTSASPIATADPVVALGIAARAADRRQLMAWSRLDNAEYAATEAGFDVGWPFLRVGNYDCSSPDMIVRACQPHDPHGPAAEQVPELLREYRRRLAYMRRQRTAAGLRRLYDARDAAEAEYRWVHNAIAATAATSYAGLAVKTRILAVDIRDGKTSHSEKIARSLHRDAMRLAKAGAA